MEGLACRVVPFETVSTNPRVNLGSLLDNY